MKTFQNNWENYLEIVEIPSDMAVGADSYALERAIGDRGNKVFELSNHLGNVLATVSDKKLGRVLDSTSFVAAYYEAQVQSVQDYYAFGWNIPSRKFNTGSYRHGFNGMEKDSDISNGSYTTEFRQLDTRIGKWLSMDPKMQLMPEQSPYSFSHNMPIFGSDPKGDVCVPCMYAAGIVIKTGINLGAQAIVNVSVDMYNEGISNYSMNSLKNSFKKVDVFDGVAWSVVPGGSAALTTIKVIGTAGIDVTAGGDKRMLGAKYLPGLADSGIKDKTVMSFGIDLIVNTGAHKLGKGLGDKASDAIRAPLMESEKALANAKSQLQPLGLWDDVNNALKPYKNVDQPTWYNNKTLYSKTQNTINTKTAQEAYVPYAEFFTQNVIIGSTMGTASSATKTVTKNTFDKTDNNNSRDVELRKDSRTAPKAQPGQSVLQL